MGYILPYIGSYWINITDSFCEKRHPLSYYYIICYAHLTDARFIGAEQQCWC